MSLAIRTVVADPPWPFDDALPGDTRGAEKNYPVMSIRDLSAFLDTGIMAGRIPALAPDCRLFLWRVCAMQVEAIQVLRAWGFALKAEIVWRKLTTTGKPHFGMGRTVRMGHEVALVGARGAPELLSHSVRSVFDAPVGAHSEKPEAFFDLVESLSPGPYLELFARRQRPGWTCMGNQMPAPSAPRPQET